MKNTISIKEFRSFVFAVAFYLVLGSILVFLGVPGSVIGFVLSLWTAAVFSFEFRQIQGANGSTKTIIQDLKRIGLDCLLLILGLTPPYLAFLGWPYFIQIFKHYALWLVILCGGWACYQMILLKKNLKNNITHMW